MAVADPGFPVGGGGGGVHPLRGAVDLQHSHFLVKMFTKNKRIGSHRGWRTPGMPPLDPPMKGMIVRFSCVITCIYQLSILCSLSSRVLHIIIFPLFLFWLMKLLCQDLLDAFTHDIIVFAAIITTQCAPPIYASELLFYEFHLGLV